MAKFYVWNWRAETTRELTDLILMGGSTNRSQLLAEAKTEFYNKALESLTIKASEQGFNLTILDVVVDGGYIVRQAPSPAPPHEPIDIYKMWLSINAKFESDVPLADSPINPVFINTVLLPVLKYILVFLVGLYAIQQIAYVLKSMTTRTHTIEFFDESGNLIRRETITNPDIGGIAGLGTIGIILIIILLIWLVGLPNLKNIGKKTKGK